MYFMAVFSIRVAVMVHMQLKCLIREQRRLLGKTLLSTL